MTTEHVRTAPPLASSPWTAAVGLFASGLALLAPPTVVSAGATERISVDSAGIEGNNSSGSSSLSADGRFVAFHSGATNLVPGDTNGAWDVFVHDRQTRTTQRVSVDSAGNQGNADSRDPALSADGRFVAFYSGATNLVPDDTNGFWDVFVHDRQTGTTERVSVDSAGNPGNSSSLRPALSADGRFVAFYSDATNLVTGDSNGWTDVFVHDRQTRTTERVNVDSAGNQANYRSGGCELCPLGTLSINSDGRFVAFWSLATNLVPAYTGFWPEVFVRDRQTGTTEVVSVDNAGNPGNSLSFHPALSADGRFVAFSSSSSKLVPGDTNGAGDVFVHDRQTRTTQRVSVDSAGNQGDSGSWGAWLSAAGRFVSFYSFASNLVPGDTNAVGDVFVHDRQTRTTQRVSVDSAGNQADSGSWGAWLSAAGRFVSFYSFASNLVPGDTNAVGDVFVHDRQTGTTQRVSVDSAGTQGNSSSYFPALSGDGRFVAFASVATNLVPGDTNEAWDVFVHERRAPAAVTTTANFDTPPPPGTFTEPFQGIDFGTGQWQRSGPYNVDPTNHIYFADSTGTSRSFQFSPGPRVLNGLRVYSTTPGTLTLSDDAGQTFTQAVTTGSLQPVTTGWTQPATTVTVSFTNGWDLGVDDITYSSAP
jgi:hypothetical protein